MARPKIPVHRSQGLAWLITVQLFAVAVAVMVPISLDNPDPVRNIGYAPIFFAMFMVTGYIRLWFGIRRQAVTVSLDDLPLLLALFYLSPPAVLIVRVVAAVIVQIIRRTSPVKLVFNAAGYTAGTACANLVVFAFGFYGVGTRTWAVLAAAVLVNMLVTLLAVGGVIVLIQGRAHILQLLPSVGFGVIVTVIDIVVGLTVLLTLDASAWSKAGAPPGRSHRRT